MSELSLAAAEWLTSPAAEPFLQLAAEAQQTGQSLVQIVQLLRKQLSAEQAHAVLLQQELRPRGKEKFVAAEKMLFTTTGLQQATDERIAHYKASRFPATVSWADLCCGIGGDLQAFARQNGCRAVDRDPAILKLAEHNVRVNGGRDCSYVAAEVTPDDVAGVAAWHLDPDRRPTGKRTVRLEHFSPALAQIEELRRVNHSAALKLAPASEVPQDWEGEVEREWISRGGECRQQMIWCGPLARDVGRRRATVVGEDGAGISCVGLPARPVPVAAEWGSFLYEPDSAVLAAELVGSLAESYPLAAIQAGIGYLTGDVLASSPLLTAFRILDHFPFDRKRLKSYLRQRNIGRLEIKKRGVELQPEELRKTLDLQGAEQATIIITRRQMQTFAVIVERVSLAERSACD